MGDLLLRTSDTIFTVLLLLVLARVILSWVVSFGGGQLRGNRIVELIFELSEPILRPFQRLIPPVGMMDFSPMAALIALYVAQVIVGLIISTIFNVY